MKETNLNLIMRKVVGVAGAFLIMALAPTVTWAADAAAGKTIYTAKCKGCHGAEGEGNPNIAKTMKVEMKPLGSSSADVKEVVSKGQGKMKPVTSVTGADLDNVAAYVKTLKK
jgi:mono/diheme cytochrome c family protein